MLGTHNVYEIIAHSVCYASYTNRYPQSDIEIQRMKLKRYLQHINSKEFKSLKEIEELPGYLQRYPTGEAIKSLAKKFNLPHNEYMQDWEYEVADVERIKEFITSYLNDDLTKDERFTIMETIIESFTQNFEELKSEENWNQVLNIIEKNISLHISTVHYWSASEVNSEFEQEISLYFRILWEKYKNNFIDIKKNLEIATYKASLNYDFINKEIGKRLSKKTPNQNQVFNYFNPMNYKSFFGLLEIKEKCLNKINNFEGSETRSPIWLWIESDFKIETEYNWQKMEAVNMMSGETLGIPVCLMRLIEEIYQYKSKYSNIDEAKKSITLLLSSIQIGSNLSYIIPKYHIWLLQEYLLPKLNSVEKIFPELLDCINIVIKLYKHYIKNEIYDRHDLSEIVEYITHWRYLIEPKRHEFEETNKAIDYKIHNALSLVNNISLFIQNGVNTADWIGNLSNNKEEALNDRNKIENKILELITECNE